MRFLVAVPTSSLLHAFGWVLLHFLWQGAGVVILLAALLALLRGRASSNVRYLVAFSALMLMLLLPAITFWRMSVSLQDIEVDEMAMPLGSTAELRTVAATRAPVIDRTIATSTNTEFVSRQQLLMDRIENLFPWLILTWLMGVMVLTARLVGGLIYVHRLKAHGPLPALEFWQEKLQEMAQQLRISKPVRLLESQLVQVPTVVGWLRPLILVPASAFTGLTPQQLEGILAHELAHIRQHDYLFNLLQTMVETLLFYHPAVWWVSRQVRIERECVCDDLAVAVCGDALLYARALTKMERLRQAKLRLAVAVDGGELRTRILRLVETQAHPQRLSSFVVGILSVAAFLTTVACACTLFNPKQQDNVRAEKRPALLTEVEASTGTKNPAGTSQQSLSDEAVSLIANDSTAGEDAEVRRVAIAALGHHAGSVIVMDPHTGRVYTVVNQEWAIRRAWTPASTMKLVSGLAGVGEKILDPSEKVRLSTKAEPLDLTDALALSNNEYFKTLGARVGAEQLISYAHRLGLGEPTGINYENESSGRLPSSKSSVDAAQLGADGEGVGVTPIQLATLISAIANGGTLFVPRVPRTPQEVAKLEGQHGRRLDVSREAIKQLIPGMVAAVERGTARGAKDPTLKIAGKTGTFPDTESSVGVFASYAPIDDPRLVVVVLTCGKNESGPVAAQITGTIYRTLRQRI